MRWGETNNRFFHDDILDPEHLDPPYDVVLCVRVLINLRGVEEQRVAIRNMAKALRPGGRLILVEGFIDGFAALDELRERVGLPALVPAPINFYSAVKDLTPVLDQYFEAEYIFHTGMYDFLTRVVCPLTSVESNPESVMTAEEVVAERDACELEMDDWGLRLCSSHEALRRALGSVGIFDGFHEKILPLARALNPDALRHLARVRGFCLRRT